MTIRVGHKPKLTSRLVPALRAVLGHHELLPVHNEAVAVLAKRGFVKRVGEIEGRAVWAPTPTGIVALADWDGGYTELVHARRHGTHARRTNGLR